MIGGAIRGYGARELLAGAVADARRGGKVLQITWCKRMHASQLRRRKRLHTLPDISLTHRTALPSAEHAVRANRTRGRETGEQCHARTLYRLQTLPRTLRLYRVDFAASLLAGHIRVCLSDENSSCLPRNPLFLCLVTAVNLSQTARSATRIYHLFVHN